jgi:molecular chaperone DnaJ
MGNNVGMSAVKRDYYDVLGVSPDADDEEIARAFQELAREWHPDVVDGPEAEARFRELAEAYWVLSRPEARLLYDRFGYRGRSRQGFAEGGIDEPRRGDDLHAKIELRSFEAEQGTRRLLAFEAMVRCTACLGRGSPSADDPADPCGRCGGSGVVPAVRRLRLRVPAGVPDGTQLRVPEEGHDAGAGSLPGDLLVWVHVLPPPRDPRIVRYIAFALLLVAVVTLVLYVAR